ncbi:MAG: phosphatase PAP2 family protein [Methylococcaceae bacterium]|nr:phosphatase PAP2 family protein [Methylococcaceae bacterium]
MDHILYWNSIALEANRRDFSNVPGTDKPSPEQGGPTLSSRALAIVHLAMYDAHAGVIGGAALPRYLTLPANPTPAFTAGEKPSAAAAAVAAAAHGCLSALYPRQKAYFDASHQGAGLSGTAIARGHAFGLAVAQATLKDRKDDPNASDNGYAASMHRGAHRADPANPTQGYHAPFYGARSKLFAVTARHELDSPSTLMATEHDNALKQVRGKGIMPKLIGTLPTTYSKRSVDESLVGVYWAYDGARELGTPPRFYNQIVREIAMSKNNSVNDNARLFAFVNVAMGDAGILAWDQKYIHDFWRPVQGIREHDLTMGPAAPTPPLNHIFNNDCDPDWLPLGAPSSNSSDKNFTPPFPAYPSGHATFGAAAFHTVRLFYGVLPGNHVADTVFTGPIVSDEQNGITRDNTGAIRPRHVRTFKDGLWQMIEENGFSRVWLGVHWSFDAFALNTTTGKPDPLRNIGGVPLGLKIAEDIFAAGIGKAPKKSTVGPRS